MVKNRSFQGKSLSSHLELKSITNILLGVTGGIAAYKTAELVRRLKEKNFAVRVVMTSAAKSFVTPMTLQAVSGNPVHDNLFDCEAEAAMGHIELAKWADIVLIAPATANSIAKITYGLADDLLTTVLLATTAKIVIAPSMNQQMWANAATVNNIKQLANRDIVLLGPAKGEQACGDVGFGRMLEPNEIVESLKMFDYTKGRLNNSLLKGKNITITAGPTVEAIDPVRFISNHSSGKMGYALAQAAQMAGANVTLISGPVSLAKPLGVNFKAVVSASEMFLSVQQAFDNTDIFIGCAAVADYAPEAIADQKIKKNNDDMKLTLKRTTDIIAWVGAQKSKPYVVGFAAESQNLESFANKKLKNKNLDMICANDISNKKYGFNSHENKILILKKNGDKIDLAADSKVNIAKNIILEISQSIDKISL